MKQFDARDFNANQAREISESAIDPTLERILFAIKDAAEQGKNELSVYDYHLWSLISEIEKRGFVVSHSDSADSADARYIIKW